MNMPHVNTAQSLFSLGRLLDKNPSLYIKSSANLAFPCQDALLNEDGSLTIYSHGLLGINAPLPYVYCEWILEQSVLAKNNSAHDFVDLLSQRFIKMDVSAWQLSKPSTSGARGWLLIDGLMRWANVQTGDSPAEKLKLHFNGHMGQKPYTLEALQSTIVAFTDLPCAVKPFKLRRHTLEPVFQAFLGSCKNSSNNPIRLGQNAFLGQTMWQRAAGIEFTLGPCNLNQAKKFSDRRAQAYRELKSTIRNFLPPHLIPSCNLIVQPPPPPLHLGRQFGSALGSNSVLGRERKPYSIISFKL